MAREDPPTLDTIAVYAEHCERNGKQIGGWLAGELRKGKRFNHCAMAISEAARVCSDGEDVPHRHRAGARELMRDAIESNTWHKVSECLAGVWLPRVGDVAVYDRSKPGRPETNGWGHVDRVTETIALDSYGNIGANEGNAPSGHGGAWRAQTSRYDNPKLLGFIAYPRESFEAAPVHMMNPIELEEIRIVGTPADPYSAEAFWWEGYDDAKSEHLDRMFGDDDQ